MKGILTTVLLLLIWGLPIIIKAVKESKEPAPRVKTPMPDDFLDEENEPEVNNDLQQNRANVPNRQEYFTYETLDVEGNIVSGYPQNEVDNQPQAPENEEEKEYELTLEEEEIYKGVIYSEILKRKFN
ncbi:MAG: hypothetical protein MJZ76_07695, partial [Bacteroidales bacterium]|nr:hypothetical protein [Bacteroidales bacterium]